MFCDSMDSIIPVESITGMKNIARNTARPAIFWLRRTAINSEKMMIAGMSNASSLSPDSSVVTKSGSTNRA